MTKKVYGLATQPGIQRDGTYFDKPYYTDGLWVRFQRGRPRKIWGYRQITNNLAGYSRGMYVNSLNGSNYIYSGYNNGFQVIQVDANGIGGAVNDFTFVVGLLSVTITNAGTGYSTAGTYYAVPLTTTTGSGSGALANITVAGGVITAVNITYYGSGYAVGNTLSASNTKLGGSGSGLVLTVATIGNQFTPSDLNLWQIDAVYDSQGSGTSLLLANPGQNLAAIDSTTNTPVFAGLNTGTSFSPLSDTNGPNPTGNVISVSGGVVVLYPYVFVYGNNGLIQNCAAGDPYNWNSADSNANNVASTKIVKGLPVRGGSNAPSGLFWALDSLIRVSYTPTTVTTGSGSSTTSSTFYWRYDIISSQTSILSSQCVIEYDGIYYWIGTDRFLLYNGVVKEIPNNMNQNYFFDNLNYAQRQKVWATKVPRFGEIWWFYPRGTATECNDAIIYNVRENCWYDAGSAVGATRTAGYFSQVFRYPVAAGEDLSTASTIFVESITTSTGSNVIQMAQTNLIALDQVVAAAGVPTGAYVTAIAPSSTAGYFAVTLSANATANATVSATFQTQSGKVSLWQHEIGLDAISLAGDEAIKSSFTTSDLGWIGGGPAVDMLAGDNVWCRLERVEPDFIGNGEMTLYVIGRPYSQEQDVVSQPYNFDMSTGKIDMKEQRRELKLQFVSNQQNGDYQCGRILVDADIGDVRGY